MAYMVEGGGSKTFQKCKEWLYRYPEESKELLMRTADVCADLLVGQVLAGAQVSLIIFCHLPFLYWHGITQAIVWPN